MHRYWGRSRSLSHKAIGNVSPAVAQRGELLQFCSVDLFGRSDQVGHDKTRASCKMGLYLRDSIHDWPWLSCLLSLCVSFETFPWHWNTLDEKGDFWRFCLFRCDSFLVASLKDSKMLSAPQWGNLLHNLIRSKSFSKLQNFARKVWGKEIQQGRGKIL